MDRLFTETEMQAFDQVLAYAFEEERRNYRDRSEAERSGHIYEALRTLANWRDRR